MAEWKEVTISTLTNFLRSVRQKDHVSTAQIQGNVRIWYRGFGDYRDSQWIAKQEGLGQRSLCYIAERELQ